MGKRNLFLVVVLLVVGLCSSAALAMDPMGPPAAGLKKGRFSAGAEYSYSRMDIKLKSGSGTWERSVAGIPVPIESALAPSFKIKNLKVNKVYANLGYGITDNWEAFLRLGGADASFKSDICTTESKFDGDMGFAIGFGTKATFYEKDKLKLGGLFQMSWWGSDAELGGGGISRTAEVDITEIQIAVGPTYQLRENVSIYGGPFWHFIDGDVDFECYERTLCPGGFCTSLYKYSYDIDEVSYFGGYIGTQIEIAKNTFFSIEYQHTATDDAIGMSLSRRF